MVAGVGFEPHGLRVMRASIDVGFKIHRLAKTYADAPEPPQKPTNVDGKGTVGFPRQNRTLFLLCFSIMFPYFAQMIQTKSDKLILYVGNGSPRMIL